MSDMIPRAGGRRARRSLLSPSAFSRSADSPRTILRLFEGRDAGRDSHLRIRRSARAKTMRSPALFARAIRDAIEDQPN